MKATSTKIDSSGRRELPPNYSSVTAVSGWPSPAQDYYRGEIDLNSHLIEDESVTFLVRVSGNAMSGVGLFDGDELIVDRSLEAKPGDIVVAVFAGELTVRRLHLEKSGRIMLLAENQNYPHIRIPQLSGLQIWGVVRYGIRHVRG